MRDATTGKTSKRRKTDTDWEALSHLSDADIRAGIESDPDAHATDENFWKDARVVLPKPKRLVTLRLDADLLEWLKRESGYQTRIKTLSCARTWTPKVETAGFYQADYGKFPKIQILTIEDLFDGKKPLMPLLDPATFKKAAREDMSAGRQEKLI